MFVVDFDAFFFANSHPTEIRGQLFARVCDVIKKKEKRNKKPCVRYQFSEFIDINRRTQKRKKRCRGSETTSDKVVKIKPIPGA